MKDIRPHRDQEFDLSFILHMEHAPLHLASSTSETRAPCSEWLLQGFIFLQGNDADYLITLCTPLRQGETQSCASGVIRLMAPSVSFSLRQHSLTLWWLEPDFRAGTTCNQICSQKTEKPLFDVEEVASIMEHP